MGSNCNGCDIIRHIFSSISFPTPHRMFCNFHILPRLMWVLGDWVSFSRFPSFERKSGVSNVRNASNDDAFCLIHSPVEFPSSGRLQRGWEFVLKRLKHAVKVNVPDVTMLFCTDVFEDISRQLKASRFPLETRAAEAPGTSETSKTVSLPKVRALLGVNEK